MKYTARRVSFVVIGFALVIAAACAQKEIKYSGFLEDYPTFKTGPDGGVDYIYVVIPGPKGLQLARGGVFSYYEFTGDINHRLTDDEWRSQVISRKLPPRPDWVKVFVSGEEPPPAAASR